MNSLTKVNDEWVPLQAKVFSRWVSAFLRGEAQPEVKDITSDLSNGVALIELAEILTHKKAKRHWDQYPKTNIEKVQNCDLALDMFEKDGVKLIGISGKDISDNNEKLILGLIWSLVLRYSIGNAEFEDNEEENSKVNNSSKTKTISNAQNQLISWAVKRTEKYENVESFVPYDLAICALLDSYYPEKINFNSLNVDDHAHNAQLAADVMKDLGIACFIYPEDLEKSGNKIDRMTLLTQLAVAKAVLDKVDAKKDKILSKSEEEDKLKADQEARKLLEEEESKLLAEREARIKEEEDRIKSEERAVAEERARIKAEEEAKLKSEQESREKAEEEARIKAEQEKKEKSEQEARIRAEIEEKIRSEVRAVEKEQERVREEEKSRQKEEENRIKVEQEAKKRSEEEAKLKAEKNANKRAEEEARLRDEAISRAKSEEEKRIKAEEHAEKVEKEKKELEEKLREAEKARKKMEQQLKESQNKENPQNILKQAALKAKADEEKEQIEEDNRAKIMAEQIEEQLDEKKNKSNQVSDANSAVSIESEEKKDNRVRIRIRIHGKNPFNEKKNLKVGIKIHDHRFKNENNQHRLVCKSVKVTTKKNGNIIPSEIKRSIKNDGTKQFFHVNLL